MGKTIDGSWITSRIYEGMFAGPGYPRDHDVNESLRLYYVDTLTNGDLLVDVRRQDSSVSLGRFRVTALPAG